MSQYVCSQDFWSAKWSVNWLNPLIGNKSDNSNSLFLMQKWTSLLFEEIHWKRKKECCQFESWKKDFYISENKSKEKRCSLLIFADGSLTFFIYWLLLFFIFIYWQNTACISKSFVLSTFTFTHMHHRKRGGKDHIRSKVIWEERLNVYILHVVAEIRFSLRGYLNKSDRVLPESSHLTDFSQQDLLKFPDTNTRTVSCYNFWE